MSNVVLTSPRPGFKYKVKSGDRITFIAQSAYGDSTQASLIVNANPQIQNNPISLENLPTIYPDNILNIPELPLIKDIKDKQKAIAKKLQNKDPNELTIELDGREIQVEAARVILTMDTVSDGWTASILWNPGEDLQLDIVTSPYSFANAYVYIGGELQIAGKLYSVKQITSETSRKKELAGFSNTIDIVDSTLDPPYEAAQVDLLSRCTQVVSKYGLQVEFEPADIDLGGLFPRVTAGKTEKTIDHLQKLAKQRGVLLSSTNIGNLLITKANTTGLPVGSIKETQPNNTTYEVTFDGRKRFSQYKAIGQSPNKSVKKVGIAVDINVPRTRTLTFTADESNSADIFKTAEWKRSSQLAEALQATFPVEGWYAPNGLLWKPNTIVTVESVTLGVPNGFDYLIKQVEFIYEAGGKKTNLTLVPPQVYTGEPLIEPWVQAI